MEWVEVRAENIEAAEELALDQLGVAREDAEFEVVTREENRLFGLKKTEARVRARVKPADLPSKTTNSNRKRSKKIINPKRVTKQRQKTVTKVTRTIKVIKTIKLKTPNRRKKIENQCHSKNKKTLLLISSRRNSCFQINASASTRMEEERIIGSIDGEDVGLLIGPKAGTLLALQDITRTVVQRHASGKKTNRLSVDVGGYREKRKASLVAFTQKQADLVKETKEKVELEPMGAADRKIVHDAAAEIPGITSSSDGEEPRRYVVLHPSE